MKKIKTIAVIGPNADRELLGRLQRQAEASQHGARGHSRSASAIDVEVLYHEGCKITVGGSWQQDEVVPSDPVEDRRSIAEAVKVAAKADVVVLAIGGNEQTSREAWMGNHLGDRDESRHGRSAGRAGRRDRGHRQADRRLCLQRPAAFDSQPRREGGGDFRVLVPWARRRARRWPRCCSAT